MPMTMAVALAVCGGLVFSGCSQKRQRPAPPAIDLVEAGKASAWSEGNVLFVSNRVGLLLEGIQLVQTNENGRVTCKIIADKGVIEPFGGKWTEHGRVVSTNILAIDLQNALFETDTTQACLRTFKVFLYP